MSKITDDDIINKFRDMVDQRYRYEALIQHTTLPEKIDKSMIEAIRKYFLESIYPEAASRKELEEAFSGLGSYVKSPRKIWGLLGNMSKAIFKFGRQFPTALKAGMNGLDAFLGAKDFEAEMVEKAHELDVKAPMSNDEFEKLMAQLPKKDIDDFIADVKKLFKIMTNTTLIKKTIGILDNVVETMKKKPKVYPKKEVDGIYLGRDILQKGYELFSQYDEDTKQEMVDLIYNNEMWFMDEVFKKWSTAK